MLDNRLNPNRVFAGILFIALFLVSCLTQKQRNKVCATCSHSDSVKVVRHDTVIVRDTTLFLSFTGDTITIPCPETKPFDVIKKLNGIKTEAKGNGKTIECICSDDSLKLVIAKIRADHYAEIDSTKDETRLLQCDKKHITDWDNFLIWSGGVLWICFIIVLIVGIAYFCLRKK